MVSKSIPPVPTLTWTGYRGLTNESTHSSRTASSSLSCWVSGFVGVVVGGGIVVVSSPSPDTSASKSSSCFLRPKDPSST